MINILELFGTVAIAASPLGYFFLTSRINFVMLVLDITIFPLTTATHFPSYFLGNFIAAIIQIRLFGLYIDLEQLEWF